jgi:hypothetical protein
MLDVERDTGRLNLALGVVPHHVDAVWILVSGGAARVHSAGLVSAQSSAAAKGDGAFRVQLVHLSPDFVNIILIACP